MRNPDFPSLSAILPLKVTGRHYGENLDRLDLLFSSLMHHSEHHLLDEVLIVSPIDEIAIATEYSTHWPEFSIRVVSESEAFEAFNRFNRFWQVRPWQRQQVIKLNAPALTSSDYVLTLDPDVLAVNAVTREKLFPGGRALLQRESRDVHQRWWRDSADILGFPTNMSAPGMGVTPALLSREILLALHARLEERGKKPWMDVLLGSYSEWTEYTLYLLCAENLGMLQSHHETSERPTAGRSPLQVSEHNSIWSSSEGTSERLRNLLSGADPGMFGVVQSGSRLPAHVVRSAAERIFPVRRASASIDLSSLSVDRKRESVNKIARRAAGLASKLRRGLHGMP